MTAARQADPSDSREEVLDVGDVVRKLERWLALHADAGWDPYDGLTSPLLRPLFRHRFAARLALQAVKRSPLNLRPLLGIRPAVYTKTLSDLAAAALVQGRLGVEADPARARTYLERLRERRLPAHGGSAWGMDLPYVSRFAVAGPATPNLFQTVNAAAAFLDAHELHGEPEDLAVALGAVEFLESGLGRLADDARGIAWRYYPGQDACVVNVNALAGALLMRLARATERADLDELGRRTFAFVTAAQNSDGSWWYALGPGGRWVDGFHTGYVLESLLVPVLLDADPACMASLRRGVEFYLARLLTPSGVPRFTDRSIYPIEVQNCAQAIQTLARLAWWEAPVLERARAAARASVRALFRSVRAPAGTLGAGYFIMARGRVLANRLPAVRWGQAPMLLALVSLQAAERGLRPSWE